MPAPRNEWLVISPRIPACLTLRFTIYQASFRFSPFPAFTAPLKVRKSGVSLPGDAGGIDVVVQIRFSFMMHPRAPCRLSRAGARKTVCPGVVVFHIHRDYG